MPRKLLTLVALVVGGVLLTAAPGGAQYAEGEFLEAQIDDIVLTAGETFTLSGQVTQTRRPGDPTVIDAAFEDIALGAIPVEADGTFRATFATPDVDPGTYQVTLSYLDSVVGIDVEVLGAAAAPGPAPSAGAGSDGVLARTGLDSTTGALVRVGGGLLLAGTAATLLATKRRRVAA